MVLLLTLACADRGPEDAPPYEPAADTGAVAGVPVASEPVTVEGRILDAETGAGVPQATFIVLRPGVTPGEWEASQGDSTTALMEAAVVSDRGGRYRVVDLIPGSRYTVMIAAAGYEPAIFDGGLAILPSDTSPTAIQPVRLDPR